MEIATSATTTPYYGNEFTETRTWQASQTQLAAVNNSQSLDLELTTRQGDKVTLSIDAQATALYGAFGQAAFDGDGALSAQWGEFSAAQYNRQVSFTVEGDLNAAERREIRKVLKTISKMMEKFVEGKLNPMMARAGKLQGLKTVDTLQVSMAYERTVMTAQQTQEAVSYDQYGAAAPATPSRTPESELPLQSESESLAREMAQHVASAQAPADKLAALADTLLKAYRDQAGRPNSMAGRIMEHIRTLFNTAAGSLDPFQNNPLEQGAGVATSA